LVEQIPNHLKFKKGWNPGDAGKIFKKILEIIK
jgi:hypothetical protein